MDVDAGRGAALGGALPTELPLTRRLRSLLSWPTGDDDPVSNLVRTHRAIHPGADAAVLRRGYAIAESMHNQHHRSCARSNQDRMRWIYGPNQVRASSLLG